MYKEGVVINADPSQFKAMENAGWSRTEPENFSEAAEAHQAELAKQAESDRLAAEEKAAKDDPNNDSGVVTSDE
ncbi:MAG: hypothetical protein JKY33_10610 [Bacteroidia bacterium]|nr:hypothetical protein [Bacteroidia bacterium]